MRNILTGMLYFLFGAITGLVILAAGIALLINI